MLPKWIRYLNELVEPWEGLATAYCDLVGDATALVRIQTYCQILVVWWVLRLARYLYELPRGLDRRLVGWSAGWEADIEAKYRHYLALAEGLYARPSSASLT